MMKDNDTKKGMHCGACKVFVTDWEEHCKTPEHKRHAAAVQPAIDRVLNGSAVSVEAALREKEELDAAKKRIEKSFKDLKLKVEEKE